MNPSPPRLGVDLGGTKTEVAVLDAEGHILHRERAPTPRGDYAATLRMIAALVHRAESATQAGLSVGIAIPGAISPATGLVKNANSTWLNGKPFDRDVETHLHRPVRVANDANCFALSEAVDGAARDHRICFGIIIGTGCGGGLVTDRKVWTGANAIAGEWGHNPLPWPEDDERPGPPCYCGKRGCIETFLSGPALAADHALRHREALDAETIARRAASGETAATETLARYVDRFARALATIVNVIDPDVVVLGGGVSNIPSLPERVEAKLPDYVFSDRVTTRVRRNVHGDSSGVRGAAWLWTPRDV